MNDGNSIQQADGLIEAKRCLEGLATRLKFMVAIIEGANKEGLTLGTITIDSADGSQEYDIPTHIMALTHLVKPYASRDEIYDSIMGLQRAIEAALPTHILDKIKGNVGYSI